MWFKKCCSNKQLVNKLKKIKLIICDVDGTLTDATVYTSEEGEGGCFFSVQDGYITKPALATGLHIALVSGKSNLSTQIRGSKIGISEDMCIDGVKEKISIAQKLQEKFSLGTNQMMIFGDDFLDATVKKNKTVGFYACPQNTPFYLQPLADLIVPAAGGTCAFRLLLDLILFANKKHFAQSLIEKILKKT
jgi:3-deoxy-D-manno-octulosonate 8-phosphate phosphatase (KDO 8-P phosphatase)